MLEKEVMERIAGFSGQKSSTPHGLMQATDAMQLKNFLVRKQSLRKAWGADLYAQPLFNLGSNGITWIDRYSNRWFVQQGPVIALETAESSKAFTEISTAMTTSASGPDGVSHNLRIRSDKWKENIFLVNGKDSKRYYETSGGTNPFITIGLIPPGNGYADASQPAISFSDGGAATTTKPANPIYIITWWDSSRSVESLPNGAIVDEDGLWFSKKEFTYTIAADHKAVVDISAVKAAGYDSRVSGWFLYRLSTADSVYRRVNDDAIDIGTSTYTDDTAEADLLGLVLDETISPPPDGTHYLTLAGTNLQGANCFGPRFVKFFRDQLWLFGASYPGSDLGYLPVKSILYGSEIDNPDYYPFAFDIARSTQEEDTGLAEFRNTLHMFKTRSIHILDGTAADNYVVRRIDRQRGCVAPGSLQETPKGIICLSSDGFIIVDGTGPAKLISDSIFDEVQNINFLYLEGVSSAYDLKEGKYECHLPTGANNKNSSVFIFDVNEGTWQFKTKAVGSAVKYDLDSKARSVGIMGDLNNSRLYTITDTAFPTFNGQTILARFASKHFDFGQPGKLKRLRYIKIKAKSVTDFAISVLISIDFGRETIDLGSISSESVFSVWASGPSDAAGMTWDVDNWDGPFVDRKFEILASGIGRNFQIIISENESGALNSGFEIGEILLEANLLGR